MMTANGVFGVGDVRHKYTAEPRDLDSELASELLHGWEFTNQRAVRIGRVAGYADDMRRGQFGVSVMEVAVWPNGRALLNGHHRCLAVDQAGCSIPIVLITHHVENAKAAGVLYGRIDQVLVRSPLDILRSNGVLDMLPFSERGATHGLRALDLIISGFERPGKKVAGRDINRNEVLMQKRASLLVQWSAAIERYLPPLATAGAAIGNALRRQGVMAVGLATYQDMPDVAPDFWGSIAANDGLQLGTAPHSLLHFLLNTKTKGLPGHHYSRYVAAAWNAYAEERPLRTLSVSPQARERPIRIVGTRYDGKQVVADPA